MKESGKRETDPGRQPQQQQGNRRQPGEGQSGDQRQQEQSSGTQQPPPAQRGPQRQNQNVGPSDEE